MNKDIIEPISESDIRSALEAWRDKAPGSIYALTTARNAVLGRAELDNSVISELSRIIQYAPKRVCEIASPITGASFNRYAYANNSPYKYVGPDGRNWALAGRGAVIGAEGGFAACGPLCSAAGAVIVGGATFWAGEKAIT